MRLFGHARDLLPELLGFVVFAEDGDVELVLRQAVILGDQVPGELDGVGFEVIAEGEIAQHLEESVVAAGVADIFEIVVLAARADAFLGGGGAGVVALFESQEDFLELVHAGVGEQQRGVVGGEQRGTAHDAMAAGVEEVEKALPDVVTCHVFIVAVGRGARAGVGPAGRARTSRPLGGAHRGGREQCLSGGHHRIHLLPWVPVFWFWIDGAPPLRPVAEPLGSQVSVAGEGIVVSELSPARWADDKVLRRIFEPFVSTDWAAIHVFRPSLTIRLKILQWRLPVARQLSYDHERSDFAVPGQHAEFTRSRVKAYQISVPGAFQGSLPQWPHHKGVRQPFVLVGSRGSELIPVPHEMPLKIVAMFKRHGAGYFTNCTSAGDGLRGGGSAGGTPGRFFAPAATVLVGLSGCMSAARANNLRKRI